MWFIVMIATVQGQSLPMDNLAGFKHRTWVECMRDAGIRSRALNSAGAHGKFLCMKHSQTDDQIRAYPIAYF
jgi:hypothetical protein